MSPEGTPWIFRRQFLHLAAGAAALPALSRIARAQAYPIRPVTLVVPFAAGGGLDTYGRIIAAALSGPLHQQVIVENIGGAGGMTGSSRVAKASPDGYQPITHAGVRGVAMNCCPSSSRDYPLSWFH